MLLKENLGSHITEIKKLEFDYVANLKYHILKSS